MKIPGQVNGMYIKIDMEVTSSDSLKVTSYGTIARSLEKLFLRNLEILMSLKPAFAILRHWQYKLISKDTGLRVVDVRSASLPICLTLMNVLRSLSGKQQIESIIGTGVLRVDGSFDESAFEDIKEEAVIQHNPALKKFITSKRCKHVFDLEVLLASC